VKSPDLEIYMSASHSSYFLFTIWLIFVIFFSYWYGQIRFNHVNSTKSYNILETIIDKEIEQKRRQHSLLDSKIPNNEDQIYVFQDDANNAKSKKFRHSK